MWFNCTSIKTYSILKAIVLVIFTPQMNFEKLLSQSYVSDDASSEIFKYIIYFHILIQPGYALENYALLYMIAYHTSLFLQLENLMYYTENNHNKVVLRDFYLSTFENGPITEPCGTPEYLGRMPLLKQCFCAFLCVFVCVCIDALTRLKHPGLIIICQRCYEREFTTLKSSSSSSPLSFFLVLCILSDSALSFPSFPLSGVYVRAV